MQPDSAYPAQLYQQLYQDLRRLAHARLRSQQPLTLLQTTALVHESFLRLVGSGAMEQADRQQFLGYAAKVMRSVIVDAIRQNAAEKRGGQADHVTLDTRIAEAIGNGTKEIDSIDEALKMLEQVEPRAVQVVEMRYFAGMTDQEIAEALGVTDRTVRRDWEKARLLLKSVLE